MEDDSLMASRMDRLEDLILVLRNEEGSLSEGEREELRAEMEELIEILD